MAPRASKRSLALVACTALAWLAWGTAGAQAYSVGSGYSGFDFATGFPTASGTQADVGPEGIATTAAGDVYVTDTSNGGLYKFGPSGGVAGGDRQLGTPGGANNPVGIAFDKAGRLFMAVLDTDQIVQLDPTTGAVIAPLATVPHDPRGLAVDPISGDLFTTTGNTVDRITDPSNGPATVTTYATIPTEIGDGIAFAPGGTMFVTANEGTASGALYRIDGTTVTPPTVKTVVSLPGADGVGVAADDPVNPTYVLVDRVTNVVTKVDLTKSPPVETDILTGGSRGDLATVGYDGCLYASQSDRVVKITNADNTCSLAPVAPTPPPTALTDTVSGASETAATLNGRVSPNGLATTYHFELGTTTSYGQNAPASGASAGSDRALHAEKASLTGLQAGATYHYRIVATNSAGTSYGHDAVFTTAVPKNTQPPTIVTPEATLHVPDQLQANPGTWSANPTSFKYQWLRCAGAAVSQCVSIAGATGDRYTLTPADVGDTVRVRVEAVDPLGTSAPAYSDPTGQVADEPVHANLTVSPNPDCTGVTTYMDGSRSSSPYGPIVDYRFGVFYIPQRVLTAAIFAGFAPTLIDTLTALNPGQLFQLVSGMTGQFPGAMGLLADGRSSTLQMAFDWDRQLSTGSLEGRPGSYEMDPALIVLTVTDSTGRTARVSGLIQFAQGNSDDPRTGCPGPASFTRGSGIARASALQATTSSVPVEVPCRGPIVCSGTMAIVANEGRRLRSLLGAAARPRRVLATSGFFAIPPHQTQTITARLTKLGRRLLRPGARIRARIVFTSITPSGHRVVTSFTVTLRGRPRRHRR